MIQVFRSLSPREQALLGLLVPVLILAAAFQFVWQPVQTRKTALLAEISAYTQVIDGVAALGAALPSDLTATSTPQMPFSTRITQSAETAGLALRRLEPDGDMLRVTLDDVGFAEVILWLSDLETDHGVSVAAIEIDRRTAPGAVSARLLLRANP